MSSDKPRISVIVPAYNVEQYIEAALDSVFAQEVQADEVIVVDDGSTDSTPDKIAEYAHRGLLIVITTENRGAGPARNEGFKHASGDYIYFFDADDLMDLQLVSALSAVVEEGDGPDVILFSGQCFLEPGIPSNQYEEYIRGFEVDHASGEYVLDRIGRSNNYAGAPSPCMYMVKHEFWSKGGFRFKQMFYEDVELFPSLLLAATDVSVVNKRLFHRRLRQQSTTRAPETIGYMRSYLEVALVYTALYKRSRYRPAGIKKFLKKHVIWFANHYLKLGRQLRVPIDRSALFAIAWDIRSWKIFRRVVRFYLLHERNHNKIVNGH